MTNVFFLRVFSDGAVTEPAATVGKGQMHDRVHSPAKGVDRQSDSKLDNILYLLSKTRERTPAPEKAPKSFIDYVQKEPLVPIVHEVSRRSILYNRWLGNLLDAAALTLHNFENCRRF